MASTEPRVRDLLGRLEDGVRTIQTGQGIASTDGDPLSPHPCRTLATNSERGRWRLAHLLDVAGLERIVVRQEVPGLGAAHGAYIPDEHTIVLAPGLSPTTSAPRRCATNSGTRSWATRRPDAGRNRRRPPRAPSSWSRPGPAWTPPPTLSAT